MLDTLIPEFDKALRTLFAPAPTRRERPAENLPEGELSEAEKRHVAALMRVNHSGEVCAQALYQGQALSSRQTETKRALEQAAWEETEHLNWTEQRIHELGGRTSLLNPLWYAGAFALGVVAGKMGDRWNLGFLAETERQVEAHLDSHLSQLPPHDRKTREILQQMKSDEIAHADTAVQHGARELPTVVKKAMQESSKVMTRTAYFI